MAVSCAQKRTNTFSVLLSSWQRITFFTSAMAASSAVQLLTVICLEVTKEDKEMFKIKSGKPHGVLGRRFISARDESRNCRTKKSSAQFKSDESGTPTLSFVRRHKDPLFGWPLLPVRRLNGFIRARDESRKRTTRKVQHSSNLTSQIH